MANKRFYLFETSFGLELNFLRFSANSLNYAARLGLLLHGWWPLLQSSLSVCGLSCEIFFCGFAVGCGGASVRFPYSKLAPVSHRGGRGSVQSSSFRSRCRQHGTGTGSFSNTSVFPISIILLVPCTHSFICHQRYAILATDTAIKC